MGQLYLVGTAHLDLRGTERLRKLFTYLSPSGIGIEDTEKEFTSTMKNQFVLDNHKIHAKALKLGQEMFPSANPSTLNQWLANTNYEASCVCEYAVENDLPVLFADSPDALECYQKIIGERKKELTDRLGEFLEKSPEEAIAEIEKEYEMEFYPVADNLALTSFYTGRDRFTAEKFRKFEDKIKKKDGNFVYIAGIDHLFGDYMPNLAHRLTSFNPVVMKLNEVDRL